SRFGATPQRATTSTGCVLFPTNVDIPLELLQCAKNPDVTRQCATVKMCKNNTFTGARLRRQDKRGSALVRQASSEACLLVGCRRDGCAVRRKMSTQNNASDSALVSNHQRGSPSMNTHDDDLRGRLGRIRNRGSHYKGFFAEVRSAARNEGYRSRSPRV